MKKFIINKYDTPKIKPFNNVQKYDVARFEYGDYDNWVNAIILDINLIDEKTLEIKFATEYGRVFTSYDFLINGKSNFNIIGKAEEITKTTETEK